MPFPFENLDVYKKSLFLIDKIDQLCRRDKESIVFSFQDQLQRAVLSVALNIAEGNGRWHTKDKQQFFWIARGSVFEIVPLIQVLHRRHIISGEEFRALYTDLEIVAKMLTNLVKSVERLPRSGARN